MTEPGPDFADLMQRAFRYALALSHDRATAEDLVQDACVGIARRGGPWETGYLLASVRNRYIDRCRRNGRVSFRPLEEADDRAPDDHPLRPGPWLDDRLEAALGRLTDGERELLFLAAVEGHTSQEIAQLTGRPLGTVLSAVYRAKQKVRTWMAVNVRGQTK